MVSLHKNPVNADLRFFFYRLMTFLMMLSVILVYSQCYCSSDLRQQLELASELESDLRDAMD